MRTRTTRLGNHVCFGTRWQLLNREKRWVDGQKVYKETVRKVRKWRPDGTRISVRQYRWRYVDDYLHQYSTLRLYDAHGKYLTTEFDTGYKYVGF